MSAPPDASHPALVRLALSRSRLSVALHRLHAKQGPTTKAQQPSSAWMDALRADPTTRVLLDALTVWWSRQPWQQSATLLGGVIRQLLAPLAQRNPLGLVMGAFAVGAVVVLTKPWRWISLPALAAGLLPQMLIKLTELAQPLSWIEVLQAWLKPEANPGAEDKSS